MTNAEAEQAFKKTVDQYYAELKYMSGNYKERSEQYIIYGILQSALHVMPNSNYFNLKRYIYERYGYDPGGCTDGQISINEWKEGEAE